MSARASRTAATRKDDWKPAKNGAAVLTSGARVQDVDLVAGESVVVLGDVKPPLEEGGGPKVRIKLESLPLPNAEGEVWLNLFEDDGQGAQQQPAVSSSGLDDEINF